jgi:hypothetical protein
LGDLILEIGPITTPVNDETGSGIENGGDVARMLSLPDAGRPWQRISAWRNDALTGHLPAGRAVPVVSIDAVYRDLDRQKLQA